MKSDGEAILISEILPPCTEIKFVETGLSTKS
jgi:hypothetical protein